MINSFAAGLLSFMIDGSRTLLVAGTRSSGKTSLLGSLMLETIPRYRMIVIEDTLELPVDAMRKLKYDILRMKVRSALLKSTTEISADEGIRTSLRLGDSSLIVGEVRSVEAKALYEAMRVGALANVVAGTIHGASPYAIFDRVVNDLGVPTTSFKATDIIAVANPIKSADGLHTWKRLVQVTEVRKHWTKDPQEEKGFVDLLRFDIEKEIKLVKVKPKTTKNIRLLFKLNRKLQNKNKSLSKDIIFGGKVLSQSLSKNIKYKEEYKNNRILPFNYLGSLNDLNSNRYFDFDFNNDLIIYKPNRNTRIELKYNISKKWKKILLKLDLIKNSEILPISIKLDRNYVCITFDDEKLNGYAFKKKEFYIDLNKLPKSDTIGRKELAVQFYNEQEERKLKNKLSFAIAN